MATQGAPMPQPMASPHTRAKAGSVSAQIGDLVNTENPDDRFELMEKLGSGSYGSVYKARDKRTGRILAIKVIWMEEDETDVEAIRKEIRILRACNNPNIVEYLGSYFKDDHLWIVMEFCGGGSVSDLLQTTEQPMPEDAIALVCRESLKGLDFLHTSRMLHRDIKGGNILLTSDGQVKLADFGVSTQLRNTMSKHSTFVGTADVWSLGITAIEMAEIAPPLSNIHPMRVLFMIAKDPPPRLSAPTSWSADFVDFVAKCLIKDTRLRPTAAELLTHPFMVNCKSQSVLQEYVHHCMDIAALQHKSKNTSDSDDSSDDDNNTLNSNNNSNTINNVLSGNVNSNGNNNNNKQSLSDDSHSDSSDSLEGDGGMFYSTGGTFKRRKNTSSRTLKKGKLKIDTRDPEAFQSGQSDALQSGKEMYSTDSMKVLDMATVSRPSRRKKEMETWELLEEHEMADLESRLEAPTREMDKLHEEDHKLNPNSPSAQRAAQTPRALGSSPRRPSASQSPTSGAAEPPLSGDAAQQLGRRPSVVHTPATPTAAQVAAASQVPPVVPPPSATLVQRAIEAQKQAQHQQQQLANLLQPPPGRSVPPYSVMPSPSTPSTIAPADRSPATPDTPATKDIRNTTAAAAPSPSVTALPPVVPPPPVPQAPGSLASLTTATSTLTLDGPASIPGGANGVAAEGPVQPPRVIDPSAPAYWTLRRRAARNIRSIVEASSSLGSEGGDAAATAAAGATSTGAAAPVVSPYSSPLRPLDPLEALRRREVAVRVPFIPVTALSVSALSAHNAGPEDSDSELKKTNWYRRSMGAESTVPPIYQTEPVAATALRDLGAETTSISNMKLTPFLENLLRTQYYHMKAAEASTSTKEAAQAAKNAAELGTALKMIFKL